MRDQPDELVEFYGAVSVGVDGGGELGGLLVRLGVAQVGHHRLDLAHVDVPVAVQVEFLEGTVDLHELLGREELQPRIIGRDVADCGGGTR